MSSRPSLRWAWVATLSALPALGACSKCSRAPAPVVDAGPPPAPELPKLLAPPTPWSFDRAPDHEFSLPGGCSLRAPPLRAKVATTTRFVADPRTLGALVIADAEGDPPLLTGVAARGLADAGDAGDAPSVPWFKAESLPHLAHVAGGWIGALGFPGDVDSGGDAVGLWRPEGGGALEMFGRGDGFTAIDVACDAGRCVVLTTRLGPVARPGALVFIGPVGAPVATWQRVEIEPRPEALPRPLWLARVAPGDDVVAFAEGDDVTFVSATVSAGGAKELARAPAGYGVLDAKIVGGTTGLVLAQGVPVGEDGCPEATRKDNAAAVLLSRAGHEPIEMRAAGPPISGAIRPTAGGALVSWLEPIGCRSTLKVVYAGMVDVSGEPTMGPPIPLGEASSYAVASRGSDVDLWLQRGDFVTWLQARCTP